MSLPTLLKQGSIIPQKWMKKEEKKKLATMTSIKWIIDYLSDRAWNGSTPPRIKIKGPGNKVFVIRSGTGTGKSTVFPPAIYNEFFENRGIHKTVICTQPTVATAVDIPFQIAMYNENLKMGVNIGYQTGSLIRKPIKGILFATVGILLQHLKLLTDEEFMQKYSYIIIDEIHNRSVETDTTLFYLRRFFERNYENPECPYLILTSGTFEPDIFMDYFECPPDAFLDVVGSSFPIQDNYSKFDITDYMTYATDLAEKIHVDNIDDIKNNDLFRDILIFAQGGGQIKEFVSRIHKLNAEVFSKGIEFARKHSEEQQLKYGGKARERLEIETYYLCPVAVTSENMEKSGTEYQNTFSPIDDITIPIYEIKDGALTDKIIDHVKASRRVIVATNAIETGLTIDTLKYCIDTGFVFESQFFPMLGSNALMNKSVTQASARQRRGRVGRKSPGVFYTCYTKDTYDSLVKLPFPDIIKSDFTNSFLDIIINETEVKMHELAMEDFKVNPETLKLDVPHNAFQMNKFDQRWYLLKTQKPVNIASLCFLQSPAADSILYSAEKLRVLGFIDHQFCVTPLGWYASKLRKITIENARMILAGYHHGAYILDLITIACFIAAGHKLGIKKRKYIPRNPLNLPKKEIELYYRLLFADDFIEYLFIWYEFMDIMEDAMNSKDIFQTLQDYADDNGFELDVLFKIITARDELIGDMLNVGMNPFYNSYTDKRGKYNLIKILQDNLQEGMEEIRKIKYCIYEGYRMNLYIWNDGIGAYVSSTHHNTVRLESKITKSVFGSLIQQKRPQKIIVSSALLAQSMMNKGMYEFSGADVSVMDGFVDVDVEFVNQ